MNKKAKYSGIASRVVARKRMTRAQRVVLTALAFALGPACGDDVERDEAGLSAGGGAYAPSDTHVETGSDWNDSDADTDTAGDTTGAGTGGETTPPLPGSSTGDSTGDEVCEGVDYSASSSMVPVDIVIAIDTSGSMNEESESVQQSLNLLSDGLASANIDAHVALIGTGSLCAPTPLGSGQCGGSNDSQPPGYLHVYAEVDSVNALQQILATYPTWSAITRPGSLRHLIVVSDDNSAMSAGSFHAQFTSLDADNTDYRFHGIVSDLDKSNPAACQAEPMCCNWTARMGKEYLQLIELTGGVHGDLCEQDFAPVFEEIAEEVIKATPVACTWEIPETEGFDLFKVNISVEVGAQTYQLYKVDDLAACEDAANVWHYDDAAAPTEIRACPKTCELLQGHEDAAVVIEFGCPSAPIPE